MFISILSYFSASIFLGSKPSLFTFIICKYNLIQSGASKSMLFLLPFHATFIQVSTCRHTHAYILVPAPKNLKANIHKC